MFSVEETRLAAPFSMSVCGSRGSGKSYFVKNLLLNPQILVEPFERILWVYKTWQPLFNDLGHVEFVNEMPENMTGIQARRTLIIFDDWMSEAVESEFVSSLFTRGRHQNISPIFLSQNIFVQGKYSRNIAVNTDYLVIFKNSRDISQIQKLGTQMYGKGNSHILLDAYNDATSVKYGYLFINHRPDIDERLKLRGNLFDKHQVVYLPKKL